MRNAILRNTTFFPEIKEIKDVASRSSYQGQDYNIGELALAIRIMPQSIMRIARKKKRNIERAVGTPIM